MASKIRRRVKKPAKKPGKKSKHILVGTIRIKAKGLKVYEKTRTSWKLSSAQLPDAMQVVKLFKAHGKFGFLVDKKDSRFLKGQLSPEGKCQGARINILPDGRKLDKAYSLFASHLTIHDETSNDHWDVIYHNPGGTWSYVYTLNKRRKAVNKKYKAVKEFEKRYPVLKRRVSAALRNKKDGMAVPMYTLLETCMRVGNEIYYKAHGHKGLTTLKKRDISIKGRSVTFNYKGKDGVPRLIVHEFPATYVSRLKDMMRPLKGSSFVFTNPSTGHPMRDREFKQAFKKYCGKDFYPHIVRSYYATMEAEKFLKAHRAHKAREASKKDMKKETLTLFKSIAEKLGHRRYIKKKHMWKENYNVTIHNYIQPDLVDKIKALAK